MKTNNNLLIADFLEWKKHTNKSYQVPNLYPIYGIKDEENTGWIEISVNELPFDTSKDWLQPILSKIKTLFPFESIKDIKDGKELLYDLYRMNIFTSANDVYNKVILFIEWYNKNKKS